LRRHISKALILSAKDSAIHDRRKKRKRQKIKETERATRGEKREKREESPGLFYGRLLFEYGRQQKFQEHARGVSAFMYFPATAAESPSP